VLAIAEEIGLSRLDATYVTRAYASRHGPLAHETDRRLYPRIEDQTNLPNEYQGTLRFGHIEPALLARTIADDLSDAASSPGLPIVPNLAVTCLDQVDAAITIVEDARRATVSESEFLGRLIDLIKPAKTFVSHGPTRAAVASHSAGSRGLRGRSRSMYRPESHRPGSPSRRGRCPGLAAT
jgi:adenylosuccinate synthase